MFTFFWDIFKNYWQKVGEILAVYKVPKPTKNGRAWYFKFSYKDAFGATKQYRSKRYLTKKEAADAERMFLVTSTDKVEDNNMTFKDLYDEFRMHNDEIMKDTTSMDMIIKKSL